MRAAESPFPHRRYNPLLDEWVLVSPQRLARPWQGQVESGSDEDLPQHDARCYLCPGNERVGGQRNPAYSGTFAFDNDFPALLPAAHGGPPSRRLLVSTPERGRCRVVCFSPRHDVTIAMMDRPAIRAIVDRWAEECAALAAGGPFAYVLPFENKGAMMGCSNPHPHGQIWATEHVPTMAARKDRMQRAYFAAHGSDLVGDYLAEELRSGDRIVCANSAWVALVPFWAVWPFEAMVVPRRHVRDLPSLTDAERDALADALKRLTVRYDNLFTSSCPYSMAWHAEPAHGEPHPYWRLHAIYQPPLLRSANIRKFLVGYELAGEPQRDLTPEEAAARLRESSERHYRHDDR